MGKRRRTTPDDRQLSLAFEAKVSNVLRDFALDIRRKGPKAVGRELGLAYVMPHWRKIGGGR